MGNEAVIRARVGGKPDQGRALLETNEVVFRGARRCVVKLDAKTRAAARVKGAWLAIGTLELELKADAPKWLGKIQNPKTVLEKLGVKAEQKVALINVKDASFARGFSSAGPGEADVIFFEVGAPADLKQLPRLRQQLPDDGVLWVLAQRQERPSGREGDPGRGQGGRPGRCEGGGIFGDTVGGEVRDSTR